MLQCRKEREQLNKVNNDLEMTFTSFVEQYTADMKTRTKENTWVTKEHIIQSKLLPYFGKLKMCNITAQQERDVLYVAGGKSTTGDLRQAVWIDKAGLYRAQTAVLDELKRIEAGASVNDELLDVIEMIAVIMDGMKEDSAYDV